MIDAATTVTGVPPAPSALPTSERNGGPSPVNSIVLVHAAFVDGFG